MTMTVYQVDPGSSPAGHALFVRAGVMFDRPLWEAPFDRLMPARLYLDHPTAPTSALLARSYDFFLAGEASPAITAFLQDAPADSGMYEWFYGFVPLTTAWREALPVALPALYREDRRHDYASLLEAWSRIAPQRGYYDLPTWMRNPTGAPLGRAPAAW